MGLRLALLVVLAVLVASETRKYVVGGIVHLDEEEVDCMQVQYRANYKSLTFLIDLSDDVKSYSISDVPNPKCGKCPESAKYCVLSSEKTSTNDFNLCTEWIYVSLATDNRRATLHANITSMYNSGWACEGIERDSKNYCMLMSAEQCLENCAQGCALLHCLRTKGSRTDEAFNMCVPSTIPEEESLRRCKSVDRMKTFALETCPLEDAGGLSVSWVIFLALAIPTVLFFAANIAYYRYSSAKRGRPPFDVPAWCPQSLYPRRESEGLQRFATG